MEKVYFTVMIFALVALCFPVMQNAALDANLTNTSLDAMVVAFPVVLLVIFAAFPIYFFMEARRR